MNGVTFGDVHSFRDLNLVLTSKNIPLPEPKTYKIEVPGSDGSIDLSTSLTDGRIKYQNRPITMEFKSLDHIANFDTVRSKIANHLHGKTLQVIFDSDPWFYYYGMCKVTDFKISYPASVTVECDADPYKYDLEETVIMEVITDSATIEIPDQMMPVVPVINVSDDMTLTIGGTEYQLIEGDNIIPSIVLEKGNLLNFTGTGTVIITFRGGDL